MCIVFTAAIVQWGGISSAADRVMDGSASGAAPAHFVGSATCSRCHAVEHTAWAGSHHHAAMQQASDETVLGNFNGAIFTKDGVESTFFKRDGKFWVRTDGPGGKLADFEIRYTFGIKPLQQYLIEAPGGRLQALGIAWDARAKAVGGQRWYHLYPDQKLKAGDPMHWTGLDQNWNYQCAWCHSTNLQKNYDAASKTYQTTWSEISVGCEACHGPASKHVTWATSPLGSDQSVRTAKGFALSLDERRNATWQMGPQGHAVRSVPRTTSKEIDACASCHAHREQFSSDPGAVQRLFDAFRPSQLVSRLYYSDGQQRDEVYTYGSFAQSKMHASGVTCSDCHDPHSGKLRFSGNRVCTQCHEQEKYDVSVHHRHPLASNGSQCAACHMPTSTYMGVDERHDHSMRIPRPDRSVLLGTPNACNACHKDQPVTWARDAVKSWYPSLKAGAQDFAEAFDLGDRQAPGAQAALLEIAMANSSSPIARASAISRLERFPSPEILRIAGRHLRDDDSVVRAAAIPVLASADAATQRSLLIPLLRDASRLVRMDAARSLVGEAEIGLEGEDRTAFDKALAEYVEGQLFNAERPEAHSNLGSLYLEQGKLDQGRTAFRTAIDVDPTFMPAAVLLADLERTAGDELAAEAVLLAALDRNPNSGPVQHALGFSLIRRQRLDEAISYLTKAAENEPGDPRFVYVLAVALRQTGKRAEAMQLLKSIRARHPYDREVLVALVSYEIEAQDFSSAFDGTKLLTELEPNRLDFKQLLAQLQKRLR